MAAADSFTKRRRSISIDAMVHAHAPPIAASTRVPLMVVEEIEGATPASPPDAVFVTLPDAALRLNVATRDQVRICWQRAPACVLIVKKLRDAETTEHLIQLGEWLQRERGVRVLVEPAVSADEAPQFAAHDARDPGAGVDLVVCIGGDGTLLHVSSLFRDPWLAIPPVLCFKGGSLGFLTVHDFADHRALLDRVLSAISPPPSIAPSVPMPLAAPPAMPRASSKAVPSETVPLPSAAAANSAAALALSGQHDLDSTPPPSPASEHANSYSHHASALLGDASLNANASLGRVALKRRAHSIAGRIVGSSDHHSISGSMSSTAALSAPPSPPTPAASPPLPQTAQSQSLDSSSSRHSQTHPYPPDAHAHVSGQPLPLYSESHDTLGSAVLNSPSLMAARAGTSIPASSSADLPCDNVDENNRASVALPSSSSLVPASTAKTASSASSASPHTSSSAASSCHRSSIETRSGSSTNGGSSSSNSNSNNGGGAGSPIMHAPPVYVIPRMRLFCRVYRRDAPHEAVCTQQPFNELLVDRGSSAFLSSLGMVFAPKNKRIFFGESEFVLFVSVSFGVLALIQKSRSLHCECWHTQSCGLTGSA